MSRKQEEASKLNSNGSCLFVCDMQEKFRQSIQYFPAIAQVCSRLLNAAQSLDVHTVVTEQYPKGLGKTVEEVGLAKFPHLIPHEKTQFSMCLPPVLNELKNKSIRHVILCGIESHVCVQGTCLDLLEQGFNVHVVVDGCSSRSMVDRMYSFERMKAAGAWLTTSESVILALLGGSAHPKFKEVQKLIIESAPDSGLLNHRL